MLISLFQTLSPEVFSKHTILFLIIFSLCGVPFSQPVPLLSINLSGYKSFSTVTYFSYVGNWYQVCHQDLIQSFYGIFGIFLCYKIRFHFLSTTKKKNFFLSKIYYKISNTKPPVDTESFETNSMHNPPLWTHIF